MPDREPPLGQTNPPDGVASQGDSQPSTRKRNYTQLASGGGRAGPFFTDFMGGFAVELPVREGGATRFAEVDVAVNEHAAWLQVLGVIVRDMYGETKVDESISSKLSGVMETVCRSGTTVPEAFLSPQVWGHLLEKVKIVLVKVLKTEPDSSKDQTKQRRALLAAVSYIAGCLAIKYEVVATPTDEERKHTGQFAQVAVGIIRNEFGIQDIGRVLLSKYKMAAKHKPALHASVTRWYESISPKADKVVREMNCIAAVEFYRGIASFLDLSRSPDHSSNSLSGTSDPNGVAGWQHGNGMEDNTDRRIRGLLGKCNRVNLVPYGHKTDPRGVDRFGEFCKYYDGYQDIFMRGDDGAMLPEEKIPILASEEGYKVKPLTWWGVQEVPPPETFLLPATNDWPSDEEDIKSSSKHKDKKVAR